MFKKTLKVFLVMVVVLSLLSVLCTPLTVKAVWDDPLEYTDLDYSVQYGDGYNTVSYDIPSSNFMFIVTNQNTGESEKYIGDPLLELDTVYDIPYKIQVFPATSYGLALANIPVGAKMHFDVVVYTELVPDVDDFAVYQRTRYLDSNGKWLKNTLTEIDSVVSFETEYSLEYVIESVAGATSFVPAVQMQYYWSSEFGDFAIQVVSAYVEMEVSTEFWSQFQAQQNGEMLGEIKDELGNVNDKLEDTNEKLEELPGEIGDEMQGIIDKENDKAESSGNKFVNQILDALPDPSTEVLSSLKSLTDATAYTGTDAKLKIPALVIPAVDGLFPETEIWGGTEFSFSDYLSFLPPTLLTVVQSLFTIAIVLFCVYELKGIISYCLTLNDKKGG